MGLKPDFSQIEAVNVLSAEIPAARYLAVDLSVQNDELTQERLQNPDAFKKYINELLLKEGKSVAVGGYLEKRNLYSQNRLFSNKRNVHLGIDLWCAAGTDVVAAEEGTIHSFANNSAPGDYGPTLILQHENGDVIWFSLYGHLSTDSLSGLEIGQKIERGQKIGTLGTAGENGNYAPHLHFQIVLDIGNNFGDYPGVCSPDEIALYQMNCPDPNLLLKLNILS